MNQQAVGSRLLAAAASRAQDGGGRWLAEAARRPDGDLPAAFACATRRVGRRPLALTEEDREALTQAGVGWDLSGWAADDAARAGLLAARSARLAPARLAALVDAAARHPTARELAALARALPLLPGASRFAAVARDAARSEVPAVFEALACDNPYPALHFPDAALRRLALRAQALGLPPGRLLGLERRLGLVFDAAAVEALA